MVTIVPADQEQQWLRVLEECVEYDFHHLPAYHRFAERRGEGLARLMVCRHEDYLLAVPLLFRPIRQVPCLSRIADNRWDVACVYGYSGPLAGGGEPPDSIRAAMQDAVRSALAEQHVVSLFMRLHPLMPWQLRWLEGCGTHLVLGETVSIDLTLPVELQRARYRKDYKRQINRMERLGGRIVHDEKAAYLAEWAEIYHQTMTRVAANSVHQFDQNYLLDLHSALGASVHLFVCLYEERVICGGLFTLCRGIVQAHLVGTHDDYLELSPVKLLFDKVRLWAGERGARVMHLGGGVGSRQDSLFHFKAGFSDRRHQYAVWEWILDPVAYNELCQEKGRHTGDCFAIGGETSFRPAYRCLGCQAAGIGAVLEGEPKVQADSVAPRESKP